MGSAAAGSVDPAVNRDAVNKFEGKNRRACLYYDTKYQLTTSVMFNLHCERNAGQLLSDVANPGFTLSGKQLTETGFDNMDLIGKQVRAGWAYRNGVTQKNYWIDFTDPFDNLNVYAYAGSESRMNDSAVRFLDGLFGTTVPRAFPVIVDLTNDYAGSARPAAADDFLLLSNPSASCPRQIAM